MSDADVMFLSTMIATVLGTVIVPWIVVLVLRQHWSATTKRAVAVIVSIVVGAIQWYVESVMIGRDQWQGLAITMPVIFGMATLSYIKYWKEHMGDAIEFDLWASVTGPPNA